MGWAFQKKYMTKYSISFFRGQSEKGTGLGLFILKEALSKLNGSITVDSLPKAGSRFIVRLPNNV